MGWKPGDRVKVSLYDRDIRRDRWVAGTVVTVDPLDLRPGVKVKLDETINGVDDCYASHAELMIEV